MNILQAFITYCIISIVQNFEELIDRNKLKVDCCVWNAGIE